MTDGAALVVSNVIGSGIFFTPMLVAGMVPDARAMVAAWVAGGILAFLGAMAYAELAALYPRAGGEYVYLREAFGPLAGFLTGWTSFVGGFSGAIAAGALAVARYLGRFAPFAASTESLMSVPLPGIPLSVSGQSLVALVLIAVLSVVHYHGLTLGRLVQTGLTGIKVGALLGFVLIGFAFGAGSRAHFSDGAPVAPTRWLLALIPIMFTYSGWNAATYVAEEIRHPTRNVPRALALGTIAVVAIYLGLNLLYVFAMPPAELARLEGGLLDATGERLFSTALADVFGVFTTISIIGSVSAMILTGPRVYYAMALDRLFVESAARVHPRRRTPGRAIVAQAIWSGLLVSCGSLDVLVDYTGFAVTLFAGVAVLAVFVLRARCPDAPRPFRALGYPVGPGLFVVASAVIIVNEIWSRPGPAVAGLVMIATGVPVYWLVRRRRG